MGAPAGFHTLTPYAVCPDPERVIAFTEKVLGGRVQERMVASDGRVMHAEVRIGDSVLMVGGASDRFPPFPAMLYVYVSDVDSAYASAIEAGATSVQEPADQFYGDRTAGVLDEDGNQWWFATKVEEVAPEEMERRLRASA